MNGNSLESKRILVRCSSCHSVLCARIKTNEGWCLEYKNTSKIKIISEPDTYWVIYCRRCQTTHRINPNHGIVESYRAESYDNRIQTQVASSASSA